MRLTIRKQAKGEKGETKRDVPKMENAISQAFRLSGRSSMVAVRRRSGPMSSAMVKSAVVFSHRFPSGGVWIVTSIMLDRWCLWIASLDSSKLGKTKTLR